MSLSFRDQDGASHPQGLDPAIHSWEAGFGQLGLQAVLDALPANIAILDPTGIIIAVNEGWTRFASTNGGEVRVNAGPGTDYLATCGEAERSGEISAAVAAKGIDAVLKGRKPQFVMQYPCDGPETPRWFSMTVTPLGTRPVLGAIVLHFDITAQRHLETELARQRETLALESRLHTLSELASGITHEITQPLTAISHYCDAIQSIMDGPSHRWWTAAGLMERIEAQTARAVEVVCHLRDFMRRMSPQLGILAVESLLQDSVGLVEISAREKNVRLRVVTAPELPAVTGDASQLKQVMSHLLRNAIEASGALDPGARTVTILAGYELGWVRISVRNSGAGVPHGWSTDLFDAIRNGAGYRQGLELGISQSIVRAHGGKLWLDSIATEGSCFHFTLPIASEADAP